MGVVYLLTIYDTLLLVPMLYLSMHRINIVAFDFLGHGDSPRPNQPELYTADEVSIYV